jgi:hypothetical protein
MQHYIIYNFLCTIEKILPSNPSGRMPMLDEVATEAATIAMETRCREGLCIGFAMEGSFLDFITPYVRGKKGI